MRNIVILGSTGSIGVQTLNIIRMHRDKFKVVALVANNNVEKLYSQAKEFNPEFVGFSDKTVYKRAVELFGSEFRLVCGREAAIEAVKLKQADTVVAAIVGMFGLESVVEAVKCGKRICLANKEALVAGGEIVMPLVKENNVELLPIDGEHSAVWQCIKNEQKHLKRLILTASGGMFFGKRREQLKDVTVEQATSHPNWSMGKKITVDCSTMMNKGLEIIEARWLFDTMNIDYIIHHQSIIHSMVEFVDGSVLAQMSYPSMECPIALTLSYPNRLDIGLQSFPFNKSLTFAEPDEETFALPKACKAALKAGGSAPCILNSANEAAVQLFLDNKISFLDIQDIVQKTLNSEQIKYNLSLSDIMQTHDYIYNKIINDNK